MRRFAATSENNAEEHARQKIVNPAKVIAAFGISAYTCIVNSRVLEALPLYREIYKADCDHRRILRYTEPIGRRCPTYAKANSP